jgi:hypothetical protein
MSRRDFFVAGLVALTVSLSVALGGRSAADDRPSPPASSPTAALVSKSLEIALQPNPNKIMMVDGTATAADATGVLIKTRLIKYTPESNFQDKKIALDMYVPWSGVSQVVMLQQ